MAAQRIIVLLNLKPGKTRKNYENWAKTTDLPTVNGLNSVTNFSVYEAVGLLGGDGKPPYDYIEIIDVADMAAFGGEVATPAMQRIAAEFQDWADPVFILTRDIGADA
jgi:hypothetical protein